MRTPMVAGNWKLNGTRESVRELSLAVAEGAKEFADVDVLVCPVYVHIGDVAANIEGGAVLLGAQDVAMQDEGAFTGEVSAPMLVEYGCTHVIVGHSERRALFGDDDATVAAKFIAAQRGGLVPVLCVGETLEEREAGDTEAVVVRQLKAVIDAAGVQALNNAVVAYEPVWAIGTGKTASPEQAQAVHQSVRQTVAGIDASVAQSLRVLYGGSVKAENARELFAQADIDGGLIGGAALKSDEFLKICSAAAGLE
ncbi:triose-phosphate isomerase [Granulosicoccaceae sp. 1_MG-2023]|nr:triose-phosphate isomerase [Granulosicoccaceae sp. 1_MG-2023]